MAFTIPLGEFGTDERGQEILGLWALIYRGYSASVPVRVWLYPSEIAALRAAAELVVSSVVDPNRAEKVRELLAQARYAEVVEFYNTSHDDTDCFVIVDQALVVEEEFDDAGQLKGALDNAF